jgi:AAA family ATP:ADP antiporter
MNDPRTLVSHPELRAAQSCPHFKTDGESPKSALERALSFFADVRSGEGASVLLLTCTVFLLLASYYLLKTAREALILSIDHGAELKAYSSAAQAVLLLGVVPAYSWLASRMPRVSLIGATTAFLGVNLLAFAALYAAGTVIAVPFYIWLGIYNVFTISQFWAFANDLYTEGQGRRLFAFIGVGSSVGAWLGAEAAALLVKRTTAEPGTLMILAAILLTTCFGMIVVVNRREVRRTDPVGQQQSVAPISGRNGFALVFSDRYLLLLAVLMVLLNVVNSAGEFLLGKLVSAQAMDLFAGDAAERRRFIAAFYGTFFGRVNLLGFLLQLFVTSRLLRALGVRGTLFVLPVIALVNYSVIMVAPVLAVVSVLKILENATDYSVQNTVKQALFLPTSREAKYKAKAAIDTFFMRLGDVMQAGIVRLGTSLGAGVGGFAAFTVGLTVLWLAVAGQIAREHRRKTV